MSMTIQDCASQTAAERRERRRQRILQNGDQRLSAILSGPNENEKRKAPCIDGIYENGNNNEQKDISNTIDKETSQVQDDIHYVAPLYYELVDRHRFWFMMALGMVFRLAVAFAWIDYVMVTFSSIFFGWEFLIAIPQKHMLNKYPKHGYIVNTLLISGLSERLVIWFGLALDLLWEFGMDLCIVTFSLICSHLLFLLADAISSTSISLNLNGSPTQSPVT